ncbi:hypothetical protein VTH82DRAFT_3822 [Thermothelomyces myriococcoides]
MAGVSCLAWAPDSNTLATGSDDKSIRLWDRVTGSPAHAVAHRETATMAAAAASTSSSSRGPGARAAARRAARMGVSTDGVRGGRTGKGPLLGHHNYVYCLAFSPKGNILASGSYDEAVFLCSTDGLIRIWDTYTGQCLRTLVHEDNPAVTNVCFSPNGRFVLAFSLDSSIRLWDYVSGSVKKTYQGHTNQGYSIGGCFGVLSDRDDDPAAEEENADGEDIRQQAFITSASEDGDIVMWDVKSKEILQRIKAAHKGVCFWVDVHGGTMVSAGQDGSIKVFRHRPRRGHVKQEEENDDDNNDGDPDRYGAVNGHLLDEEMPDAAAADEELQRQLEAEAEAAATAAAAAAAAATAGSPGQHVKEEQV